MFKKYCLRLPALLLSLALCCSFFAVPVSAGGETAITTEEESVFPFTIADAIKILKHCTGMITLTPEETERLDVDFDSAITLRDAIIILKVITEGVSKDTSIQYIRTGRFPDSAWVEVTVIKSKVELDAYYEKGKGLDHRYDYDRIISFKEAIQKYEADYFDDNVLVLVHFLSSSSIRHKVSDIDFKLEEIDIIIEPFGPEVVSLDEAWWHIILEMEKSDYADKEIKINFSEYQIVNSWNEFVLILWKYGQIAYW